MSEITPEQLRELADKMDGGKPAPPAGARPSEVRRVDVDGVAVDIDMRRVRDYRAMSLIAKIESGDSFAAITLFEFLLGDQVESAIRQLSDEDGFCDAERFVRFCGKLLEEVGAKN